MCVDYASVWTMISMLRLGHGLYCSMVASMAWNLWCFYGLNYAFTYPCFYDTSMGHYTWYLITCYELSLRLGF
jgi:hypothetical protein